MSEPINADFVDGSQFHPDQAHGPFPDHMDIRQRLPDLRGINQKLRVDESGGILSDELEIGKRFLNDLEKS